MLLTAPTFFNLKTTDKGTVLVDKGVLQREGVSAKFGNREFYFYDETDEKLKCLAGGQLNYIIDMHSIDASKVVKIVYDGTSEVKKGKFAGTQAHQFEIELVEERAIDPAKIVALQSANENLDPDNLD